ncbi:MAG: DegT/DnrJ/EryC1/StrS family aminotransferase [Syntrophobacteraceae bacterium]
MKTNETIPFLDLVTLHAGLEEELVSVFRSALKCAGFIGGPMVENFERDFSQFCGTKHCVGVGSGTDALRFALMAAGVEHGDIVITVPNTFIATTEAISQSGAIPDFVDVMESTCNMNPDKLREYLETKCSVDAAGKFIHKEKRRRVTAVVPVHLYGQPADMDSILDLAEKYNLTVIEDACQAHGAEYFSRRTNTWKKAGAIGRAAAFSFYPGKNLGACGEAGAVTTDSDDIAKKIRIIRDHGQSKKYFHDIEGYNGRLDSIQAGILSVKLKHLTEWNKTRRSIAVRYTARLQGEPGVVPPVEPDSFRSVYHLYVIRMEEPGLRDRLQAYLAENGVATGLHYPVPLHLQNSYSGMNYLAGSFPVAEALSGQILSLPMGPTLASVEADRVPDLIASFIHRQVETPLTAKR